MLEKEENDEEETMVNEDEEIVWVLYAQEKGWKIGWWCHGGVWGQCTLPTTHFKFSGASWHNLILVKRVHSGIKLKN